MGMGEEAGGGGTLPRKGSYCGLEVVVSLG